MKLFYPICFLALLVVLSLQACTSIQGQDKPTKITKQPAQPIKIEKLHQEVNSTMQRYLIVSLERFADDRQLQLAILDAQKSWQVYVNKHCEALFMSWQDAGLQIEERLICETELMQLRTIALWRSFLTFEDSSPPILPKPNY